MQKTSSLSSLFSLDKPTPLTDTGTGPKKQPKSANTKRNSAHPSDQPKHKPAQPNGKPHGKQQDTKHDDKDLELPDHHDNQPGSVLPEEGEDCLVEEKKACAAGTASSSSSNDKFSLEQILKDKRARAEKQARFC
ncbi:hypothetical protein PCASD_02329 [Puccinia coronata f. sp. avenae]|uniref:Uncharacterized protein n=1 Tax=Puccinia coronata f. sp. avenae TaxID=200324 RepID=A0A2N5VB52_9BASI|nr:hypothetical protein PCASD_02329 [Puccinia coronata f. sp. avenae]